MDKEKKDQSLQGKNKHRSEVSSPDQMYRQQEEVQPLNKELLEQRAALAHLHLSDGEAQCNTTKGQTCIQSLKYISDDNQEITPRGRLRRAVRCPSLFFLLQYSQWQTGRYVF